MDQVPTGALRRFAQRPRDRVIDVYPDAGAPFPGIERGSFAFETPTDEEGKRRRRLADDDR
jgi:hypothetical protein